MTKRAQFTLRIDADLDRRLDAYAKFLGKSKSEVIEDAIGHHLATKPDAGADSKVRAFIEAYMDRHHPTKERPE